MSSTVASSCNRCHRFRDNLRRERPDDVHAQNFAVCFVRHHFNESVVLRSES